MRIALLPLVAFCALPAAAHSPDRSVETVVLTKIKEIEWNGFYRRRDAAGLERFLHPDFVLLNPDGTTETRNDAVDYVRTNEWPGASNNFEYRVSRVQFISNDAANVFGNGYFDGADSDGKCRMRYTSSNILVRQKDGWHPVFSHTSPAECSDRKPAK